MARAALVFTEAVAEVGSYVQLPSGRFDSLQSCIHGIPNSRRLWLAMLERAE